MKKVITLSLGILLTALSLKADNSGMQASLEINTKLRIRQSGWSDYSGYMSRDQYENIVIHALEGMLHKKGIRISGPTAAYKISVDHMLLRERLVKHTEKDPHNPSVKRTTLLAKVSIHLEGWVINVETGERKRWKRTSSAKESLKEHDADECSPPRKVRMSPDVCANLANSVGRRAARRLHRKMHRMD